MFLIYFISGEKSRDGGEPSCSFRPAVFFRPNKGSEIKKMRKKAVISVENLV